MLSKIKNIFKKQVIINEPLKEKYQRVFAGPEGQEVLEHILRSCCITESTFVAGDALTSAHNEGRRSVGLHILKILEPEQKLNQPNEEI